MSWLSIASWDFWHCLAFGSDIVGWFGVFGGGPPTCYGTLTGNRRGGEFDFIHMHFHTYSTGLACGAAHHRDGNCLQVWRRVQVALVIAP